MLGLLGVWVFFLVLSKIYSCLNYSFPSFHSTDSVGGWLFVIVGWLVG